MSQRVVHAKTAVYSSHKPQVKRCLKLRHLALLDGSSVAFQKFFSEISCCNCKGSNTVSGLQNHSARNASGPEAGSSGTHPGMILIISEDVECWQDMEAARSFLSPAASGSCCWGEGLPNSIKPRLEGMVPSWALQSGAEHPDKTEAFKSPGSTGLLNLQTLVVE